MVVDLLAPRYRHEIRLSHKHQPHGAAAVIRSHARLEMLLRRLHCLERLLGSALQLQHFTERQRYRYHLSRPLRG